MSGMTGVMGVESLTRCFSSRSISKYQPRFETVSAFFMARSLHPGEGEPGRQGEAFLRGSEQEIDAPLIHGDLDPAERGDRVHSDEGIRAGFAHWPWQSAPTGFSAPVEVSLWTISTSS